MSTDFNAASWTAVDLLTDVYRACRLPATGTVDYPPTVVLNMATQSLHDWAGHLVSTAMEGRLVTTTLRAVTSSALDTSGLTYELPNMSVADTVEAVIWVDPVTSAEKRLERVPAAMLPIFTRSFDSGTPTGYAFMDGTIQVFPRPSVSGNLKLMYQRRHSVLTTAATDYALITSMAGGTGETTVVGFAALPATFTVGAWLDIVENATPHRTRLHGLRVTSIDAFANTATLAIPFASFALVPTVGRDVATIYGKVPFVQLPLEMREPYTRQISSRLLSEIGDLSLSQAHDQMAQAGAGRVRDMMQPRAKGQPEKLYSPNSIARMGRSGRRWWPL